MMCVDCEIPIPPGEEWPTTMVYYTGWYDDLIQIDTRCPECGESYSKWLGVGLDKLNKLRTFAQNLLPPVK